MHIGILRMFMENEYREKPIYGFQSWFSTKIKLSFSSHVSIILVPFDILFRAIHNSS